MEQVIIFEDCQDTGWALKDVLEFEGFEASLPASLEEGLRLYEKHPTSKLIVNLLLGDKLNYQILVKALESNALDKERVIITTAIHPDTINKEYPELNKLNVLRKPYDMSKIIEKLGLSGSYRKGAH